MACITTSSGCQAPDQRARKLDAVEKLSAAIVAEKPESGIVPATVIENEAGVDVPAAVLEAAADGMGSWINKLDVIAGASPGARFEHVTLGAPYLLYTVSVQKVISKASLVDDDLVRRDVWYFPVVSDGKYIAWLKVKNGANGWKVVGMGGASASIGGLETELKAKGGIVRRSIVQVTQLGLDFISLQQGSALKASVLSGDLYPLEKASRRVPLSHEPSAADRVATDATGMLNRIKDEAELFEYKGVTR